MTDPVTPTALASIDDLQARLGRSLDAGAETDRAQAALDDTSAYIATFGTFTDPVNPAVTAVACAVALRLFRNPDELSSETTGSYTWRAADGTAAGLFLTDQERAVVQRFAGGLSRGLWTQQTTRDDCDLEFLWGSDQYDGDPILLGNCENFG